MRVSGLFRGRTRVAVAAALPFAFAVRERDATAVDAPPLAENERVEKRWQLEQSATAALHRVQLHVPGLTYVTYDARGEGSETMATVRVSGDSREIVECVEVVPLPPHGVELRWKSRECEHVRGHLLTSLSLAREAQVNELRTRGRGTVVVEDGVLLADCEDATVCIEAEGVGQTFVTTRRHDMNLRELHLSTVGGGELQFVGPDKVSVRDQVLLEVAGDAKLRTFVGRVDANFLRSSVAVASEIKLTSTGGIHADKIKTNILDDGNVVYEGEGQCRVQRVTIVGSGKVDARGIVCKEASVEAYGDADATLNASDKFQARGWSSTKVSFVGEKPKVLEGKSVSVKTAPSVKAESAGHAAVPPQREAAFMEIQAIYESNLGAFESTTGVRKIVQYLMSALGDKKAKVEPQKSFAEVSSKE